MTELYEKLRTWKPNFVYVSSGIEVRLPTPYELDHTLLVQRCLLVVSS